MSTKEARQAAGRAYRSRDPIKLRANLIEGINELASNGGTSIVLWHYPRCCDDNRDAWDDKRRLDIRRWWLRSMWIGWRYYPLDRDKEIYHDLA